MVPDIAAEALMIQAPVINTLVTTESTIKKRVVKKDQIKYDGLASHFEYISTMSSFDDSVFKKYHQEPVEGSACKLEHI